MQIGSLFPQMGGDKKNYEKHRPHPFDVFFVFFTNRLHPFDVTFRKCIFSRPHPHDVFCFSKQRVAAKKWRGADVPLLSFEASGGEVISRVNLNTQAVVLYAVSKDGINSEHPYLGLIMSGVPHVSQFSRGQIQSEEDIQEAHPMVAQKIRINGASVSILDVDAMVAMVEELAA